MTHPNFGVNMPNRAVKRLIAINRIQNKCFCLHNMDALCIIISYINTHTLYFLTAMWLYETNCEKYVYE